MKLKSAVAILVLGALPLLVGMSGGNPSSPAFRFTREAAPHVETVAGWMVGGTVAKATDALRGAEATSGEAVDYFSLAGRAAKLGRTIWGEAPVAPTDSTATELSTVRSEMDRLRPKVERRIQGELAGILTEDGLGYRAAGLTALFPPVFFRFEALPNLLVVSPRARIERTATVLLDPQLTLQEAEKLENSIYGEGFSAIVTQIGGLGVYPSIVPDSSDVRGTLRTVAHEWGHQFFAFRPLGWRYAFGAEGDPRMVTINETAAEILGREIGDEVYARYYAVPGDGPPMPPPGGDLFNRALRDIRAQADALLAEGNVGEAEAFLEKSRQDLAQKGFYVRKLNQAYLAFYGSYADEPAAAGPVGEDISRRMHALRDASGSAGDFAWRVSNLGSYDDLLRLAP